MVNNLLMTPSKLLHNFSSLLELLWHSQMQWKKIKWSDNTLSNSFKISEYKVHRLTHLKIPLSLVFNIRHSIKLLQNQKLFYHLCMYKHLYHLFLWIFFSPKWRIKYWLINSVMSIFLRKNSITTINTILSLLKWSKSVLTFISLLMY